jgi:sugar phosphate permease
MGYLSDHYDAHIPMLLSSFLSALSVFLLWGFSKSLGPLLIFSILYGVFAGGYSVLYCRFATSLTSQRATGLWLYSIFEFQRGAGNIIGGSVSGLLVKVNVAATSYSMGKYDGIVLLVGGSMLVSLNASLRSTFGLVSSILAQGLKRMPQENSGVSN